MSDQKHNPDQAQHAFIIAGKPATEKEYKRILSPRAHPSDPNLLATKPIGTMSRPFSLLK